MDVQGLQEMFWAKNVSVDPVDATEVVYNVYRNCFCWAAFLNGRFFFARPPCRQAFCQNDAIVRSDYLGDQERLPGRKSGTKDLFGACIEWGVLPDNIGIATSPNGGEEWELSIYAFSGQNSHGGRQLSWKDTSHAYLSITTSSLSVNKRGSPDLLDWINPKPNIHFPFGDSRRKAFHFG
jgi:hypothetical protein